MKLTDLFLTLSLLAITACGGGGGNSSIPSTAAPSITAEPANAAVNVGSSASFTVAASGNPTPTFTWSRSNDGGSTWTPIGGATAATYSFTPAKSDNLASFQATATNSAGTAKSTVVNLTVQWLILTGQPAGEAITAPNAGTFTVTADANPAPAFQWQSSPDGTTWTNLTGATSNSYTTGASSLGNSGTRFHCLVSNAAGTLTSDPAILTVNAPLAVPAITTQPLNQTVNGGSFASFTVAASGNPSPTFAWERSNDGGITWAGINGANSSTYGFTTSYGADNGAKFRAVATNSQGNDTSAVASLTVAPMVYAAGWAQKTGTANTFFSGYWLNGTWVALGTVGANYGKVSAIYLNGGHVYAAGYRTDAAGLQIDAGYWVDGAWVSVTPKLGSVNWYVFAMAFSGSDVYASGYCDGGGLINPGYWKNGSWVSLPWLTPGSGGDAYSIVISGSDVYAAGFCDNGATNVPGYWKNGTWTALPDGAGGGTVTTLILSGSDLYAAGYQYNMSPSEYQPGYWKNGTWVGLPFLAAPGGEVNSLVLSGNDVYAAGYRFDATGTVALSGYWLNGVWNDLTPPSGSTGGDVNSLVLASGNLFAAGYVTNPSFIPGYWLNGNWNGLALPSGSNGGQVTSIFIQ